MGSKPRSVSPALIVGGIFVALIIIVSVILIQRMTRQEPEPARTQGAGENATEQGKHPAIGRHEEDRPPEAETETIPDETEAGRAEQDDAETDVTTAKEEAPEGTGYSISGHVVDTKGKGLANATVQALLRPSPKPGKSPIAKEVTTDAAGAFRFDDLPKEMLYLTASQGDLRYYRPTMLTQGRAGRSLPVPYQVGRDRVTGITLTLRPTLALAGRVTDMTGGPIANAVVAARDQGMPVAWRAQTRVKTDEQGGFRITGVLPGGIHLISAEADGFIPVRNVHAWVPNRGDEFLVTLERGVTVQGNAVVADSGSPAPGAQVRATAEIEWFAAQIDSATTDAEGHFEILVHPEVPTKLKARWEDYVAHPEPLIEGGLQDGSSLLRIELVKGGTITGIVRDKGTEQPVADVDIMAHTPAEETLHVKSNAEGTFSFDALAPGRYVLEVPPYEYEASEPKVAAEVVPDGEPAHVEIWVTAKPTLAGVVVDVEGNPIAEAFVVPVHPGREAGLQLGGRATTDADGRFVVRTIFSNEPPMIALLASHPDYCNKRIELAEGEGPGSGHEVHIVLEQGGGSISGMVTDDGGGPIALAQVRLISLNEPGLGTWRLPELKCTLTDEAGRYFFGAIAPGTYRVKAVAYGQEVDSGDVVVAAGQKAADVNLTVAASGHLAGRVTDTLGAPIAGVKIAVQRVRLPITSLGFTDADGRFRIPNLVESQQYHVWVHAENKGYSRGFQTVTCSADNVDFALERPEFCTIRGVVLRKADNSPVTQFNVRIITHTTRSGSFSYTEKSLDNVQNGDGSFECSDVLPGAVTIEVTAPGCPKFTGEPFEVKPGEEVAQTIYLDTGGTIRGTVCRKSDRSPVTQYQLTLRRRVEGRHEGRWPAGTPQRVESAKGAFECTGLEAGTYAIMIVAEGLPDFLTESFELAADGEVFREVFVSDGGVIKGKVVDEKGRPVPDAVVDESRSAWERHNPGIPYQYASVPPKTASRTKTDGAGEFVLRNLTPGKVTIRVEHPDYAESEVVDIEITEDVPTENVVIMLEGGAVLYGWIKDLDGKPLQGATLRICGGERMPVTAGVDHNGQYRSPRLPRGKYRLELNYCDAILPRVTVKDEKEIELNIDFTEAGTISGTLNLPSETPDMVLNLYMYGLDEMNGGRWVGAAKDGTFEFRGIFEGRYLIRIAGWVSGVENQHFLAVTDPKEITINVRRKEDVKQDIDVLEFKEYQ